MTQPTNDEIVNQAPSRFFEAAGLRFTEVSGTRVRGEIHLGTEHHTPWGVVHGGVYTTAVESAASLGASTAVADRGQIAVGVANSTDFIRPISSGAWRSLPRQSNRVEVSSCGRSPSPAPRTASWLPAVNCD
jgi:uncharacterized protein (TIGR00369 family)